jgi:lipopolysaccharide export system protein LptC
MILILLVLVPLLTCKKSKTDEQNGITPSLREGAEGFVLVDTKGEKRNWILKADRALNYNDSITLYNVTVEFYDAEGIQVVVSRDTTTLKTTYLDWNNKRQKIITEDAVEITKKNSIITGQGMESDPNLEHITIMKDFNAVARDVHEE